MGSRNFDRMYEKKFFLPLLDEDDRQPIASFDFFEYWEQPTKSLWWKQSHQLS